MLLLMMVKGSVKGSNNSGVAAVVLGILSIVFAFMLPFLGLVFGVISLFFSIHQRKVSSNSWANAGITLSIIGIVLSIAVWILLTTVLAKYIGQTY